MSLQVCKYPDKTKRSKLKLSSDEFAATQVTEQHIHEEYRDVYAESSRQASSHLYLGWKTDSIEGDGDHRSITEAGLNARGLAMDNMETSKRFSSEASSSGPSKRPRPLHSAPMTLCKSFIV